MFFGKYNTQELIKWSHSYARDKWDYSYQDPDNWWWYNLARNNPTSTGEKIINWYNCVGYETGAGEDQIWAYIMCDITDYKKFNKL